MKAEETGRQSDMQLSLSTNATKAASWGLTRRKLGLTSQQSRSVGTQQLCRSRPAHQSLSTAS